MQYLYLCFSGYIFSYRSCCLINITGRLCMPIDRSLLQPYQWWEDHKKISTYHFKPTEIQETDIISPVCTFRGDWSAGIGKAADECSENFIELGNPNKDMSSGYQQAESDMYKLAGINRLSIYWQADVYNGTYDDSLTLVPEFKCNHPEYKPFYLMAEKLGYTEVHAIKVTFQRISQVCAYHLDLNEDYFKESNLRKRYDQVAGVDHLRLRKTFVALTPYDIGQVWYFGDQYWKNYQAGEAVTFDWKNMPHGTANLGFSLRCNLLIMGFVGNQFYQLVKNGSKDKIIDLN